MERIKERENKKPETEKDKATVVTGIIIKVKDLKPGTFKKGVFAIPWINGRGVIVPDCYKRIEIINGGTIEEKKNKLVVRDTDGTMMCQGDARVMFIN